MLLLHSHIVYYTLYYTCIYCLMNIAQNIIYLRICKQCGLLLNIHIQDLGCGWGALALYILEKFPTCKVMTVSNSSTQRVHIQGRGQERGYGDRLECITADANIFSTEQRFDRIVSIEMFEVRRKIFIGIILYRF